MLMISWWVLYIGILLVYLTGVLAGFGMGTSNKIIVRLRKEQETKDAGRR